MLSQSRSYLLYFALALLASCVGNSHAQSLNLYNAGQPTYFRIQNPARGDIWTTTGTNEVSWVYAQEGIVQFDIELVRLKGKGLLLVGKNIPIKASKVAIDTSSVPPGDDYFLVFMDSYDGQVYSRSPKFAIEAASNVTIPTGTAAPTLTLTITGTPNPTRAFETTIPAIVTKSSAAFPRVHAASVSTSFLVGAFGVVASIAIGGSCIFA